MSNTIDMDYDIAKYVFEKNLVGADIVITGGEPTLHKKFCNFVDCICRIAKNVYVTTNGTESYYVNHLSKYENLFFQVSLDGDERTNDAIRGEGSYSRIQNTLNLFDESQLRYSVASAVSRKNENTISNLIPYLCSLKRMCYWRISYAMPFGNSDFSQMLTAEEWNDLVDSLIKKSKFRIKIQKIFPFNVYDKKTMEDGINFKSNRSYNCGNGRDKIYIYPDFNVYSCTCLTDFCLGNLRKENLKSILNGEKIKSFSEYKINDGVPCNSCKYHDFCKGGCIGMSYHYFGILGQGDIRCPILRDYYDQKDILF